MFDTTKQMLWNIKNHLLIVFNKIIILGKKFYLPILGIGSLVWFLVRVIPKPSRAAYPCMKVAAPIASSFVLWLIGLVASVNSFSKMKASFKNSSYISASIFLALGVIFGLFAFTQDGLESFASTKKQVLKQAVLEPNEPMGTPVGIFPGRVVWVHDADATNENCDPMAEDHSYFEPENTNQYVVDAMISKAIQSLTAASSDSAAWDSIFKFHNNTRGKGEVGYQSGEKIFLKINATSAWSGNYNDDDLSKVYSSMWGGVNSNYGLSETTPEFMMGIIRQLVYNVHVPQEDIYIGDPMKFIYKHVYEYLHAEFPNVHYLDHTGHTNLGRELAEKGTTPLVKYSDRGSVLVDGGVPVYEDKLYKIYKDMEYMLNLPQMKGHIRGGVTMFAKNHFGSQTRDGANHLHNGLVSPGETGLSDRTGYGLYRVQVDLMGHEILGGKNLVYLMDALWSTHHELSNPHKWQMAPFNNDWTSSVFASFDPVAIESVGYDFVRSEFTFERYPDGTEGFNFYNGNAIYTIQAEGVCDYLRQAADSANWPEGIKYDPEDDGTIIGSLGVHEHWNNSTDKEYSKNLGNGDGIELVKIEGVTVSVLFSPSELSALVSNESDVELSWTDNSDNEEGFIIERKENSENASFVAIDTVGANQTSYTDVSDKLVSSYYYRIKAYNSELSSEYSEPVLVQDLAIVGIKEDIVSNEFKLNQNYPNPFNPTTNISFSINKNADVKLEVYDVQGNLINVLIDDNLNEGFYNKKWDSKNNFGLRVSSGIYIYRISINSNSQAYSESKKMTLLK